MREGNVKSHLRSAMKFFREYDVIRENGIE